MEKIQLQHIYESDVFLFGKERQNWFARLRRKDFKRSVNGEAYYHPDHWDPIGMGSTTEDGNIDPGDYYIIYDAFKAKTPEAKSWASDPSL